MTQNNFSFNDYAKSIEARMQAWYHSVSLTFTHGGTIGNAREHFITEVLEKFLPRSVSVGNGQIIDGEVYSGQQDLIIYRNDFPVITGFGNTNVYLVEGVIATIEVKSDLSSGTPNGLISSFKNIKGVQSLNHQARYGELTPEKLELLQKFHHIKSFVIGYKGWGSAETLLQNYKIAGNETEWRGSPDLVYQPEICVMRRINLGDPFVNYPNTEYWNPHLVGFSTENCFSFFFNNCYNAFC